MSKLKDEVQSAIEKLKTERDEIKVQLSLGKMELKEELREDWQLAEETWQKLITKKVEIENSMDDKAEHLKEEWRSFANEFKNIVSKIGEKLHK